MITYIRLCGTGRLHVVRQKTIKDMVSRKRGNREGKTRCQKFTNTRIDQWLDAPDSEPLEEQAMCPVCYRAECKRRGMKRVGTKHGEYHYE
jgi:hypothetical protein